MLHCVHTEFCEHSRWLKFRGSETSNSNDVKNKFDVQTYNSANLHYYGLP
jgi:hypothetical protein